MSDLEQLTQLAREHQEKKAQIADMEEAVKGEKAQLRGIEGKMLQLLDKAEITKYAVPEIGTFSKRTRVSYQTPKTPEEKKAYFDFLKDKGVFEGMITVNANTHTSFCKEVISELAEQDPLAAANFEIPGVPGKNVVDLLGFRKA